MSYKIVPLVRRVWDERKGEVVDLDVYGYSVVDHNGRTISEGETKSEALERASSAILLPSSKSKVARV